MKLLKTLTLTVCSLTLWLAAPGAQAQNTSVLTVLHSFGPTNEPPLNPSASLVQGPDGTLYGTTEGGGFNNGGTVFKVQPDGTGLTVLRNFTNSPDGANPIAALLLSGSRLYGTAQNGGSGGGGTVFAVNTDGTGYTNLYNFGSVGNDGNDPAAGLILSDSRLYGTTRGGGSLGGGTVFAVNTDGTGYIILCSFTNLSGNWIGPTASLILSGNTLYGTTSGGGSGNSGTVFAVNTDGTGPTNLYNFSALTSNTNGDGAYPAAELTLSGGRLYGTTVSGGAGGSGTLFAVNTDGTGFTNLYSFSAVSYNNSQNNWTNSDGANPQAGLLLSGSTLYGTTANGGTVNQGTVFAISTNGAGFTNLLMLTNPRWVFGTLILSGGTLYGTSFHGGNQGDDGCIYSLDTNGANFTVVYSFGVVNLGDPQAKLVLSGSTLFGTTRFGGNYNNNGTVFAVNTDGTGFTNLYSFTGSQDDGANPHAGLVLSGSTLYGTAQSGGPGGNGTVFAINTNGTGFRVVHGFTGGGDASGPGAALLLSGNTLYGTTVNGGDNNNGTVFKVNTDGTGYALVYSGFSSIDNNTNSTGAWPWADLVLSGSTLYGTAQGGGAGGQGTVFAVNTNGTGFTILHNFSALVSGTNSDGDQPDAGLILSGGTLYGTAIQGGSANGGTVFALSTNGSNFTVLHAFLGSGDGANPQGDLILSGQTLYGTTGSTAFAINTNGTGYLTLYNLNGSTDGNNSQAGLVLSGSTLYGTATDKGAGGNGTVFAITYLPGPVTISAQPQSLVVNAYNTALFTVTAAGTPPLDYQWTFNGTNISGATASSLMISSVTPTNLGVYGVVVTNLYGPLTSSNATLAMYPFLTVPFDGVVADWGQSATLSVQAWGTGPLGYQWYDNGIAIPNATNQTWSWPGIQFTNAGLYSVVVSSPFGSVTNTAAQVVVNVAGVSLVFSPTLIINGVPGFTYVIQSTTNLENLNAWVTLTNMTLVQPTQLFIDTTVDASSPFNPQHFYKISPSQ